MNHVGRASFQQLFFFAPGGGSWNWYVKMIGTSTIEWIDYAEFHLRTKNVSNSCWYGDVMVMISILCLNEGAIPPENLHIESWTVYGRCKIRCSRNIKQLAKQDANYQ